jgi:hypothetical protein
LAIADQTASKTAGQTALEVSSGLAALEMNWDLAARLYGAAEAQTLQTGIRRDPADEAFLQPLLARTREALGESGFAKASASGGAMPFKQAMAEAGAWLSPGDD